MNPWEVIPAVSLAFLGLCVVAAFIIVWLDRWDE